MLEESKIGDIVIRNTLAADVFDKFAEAVAAVP